MWSAGAFGIFNPSKLNLPIQYPWVGRGSHLRAAPKPTAFCACARFTHARRLRTFKYIRNTDASLVSCLRYALQTHRNTCTCVCIGCYLSLNTSVVNVCTANPRASSLCSASMMTLILDDTLESHSRCAPPTLRLTLRRSTCSRAPCQRHRWSRMRGPSPPASDRTRRTPGRSKRLGRCTWNQSPWP